MSSMNFEIYSHKHIQFLVEAWISDLLKEAMTLLGGGRKPLIIIDVGCGDGSFLYNLKKRGLIKPQDTVIGLDLSGIRLNRAKYCANIQALLGDAQKLPFKEDSFDFVICSQLIEHVPDDERVLDELSRVCAKNGVVYISTILKKTYGIYIYRVEGKFRLDPTHIREYKNSSEIEHLIKGAGLTIKKIRVVPIAYPSLDLVFRLMVKLRMIDPDTARAIYAKDRRFAYLNKVRIPIIGYYHIESVTRSSPNDKT